MQRTVITGVLALATIICAILISGCSAEPGIGNNTTLSPSLLPAVQRPNLALTDTVPACGYVRLEGKNITGAIVIAVSTDGTDSVSTVTNDSGAYVLNVKAGTWYRVTATYQGLQHTVFPVVLSESGNAKDQYAINLTRTHRSTITGSATQDSPWRGSGVYIEAVTQNSSEPVVAVTGSDGSYSINVEPGIYYYLAAEPQYYDDKYFSLLYYRNGGLCRKIKLGRDETALLDYHAIPVLAIGSLTTVKAPPGPMQASGQVFIEDKVIGGAIVEAVSIDGADRVTTSTDVNGFYRLNLESMVPYRVTAKYIGHQHTIWPVYLSNESHRRADKYDINLTIKPGSTIAGFVSPHHMVIEAVPVNGGTTVTTVNGFNDTYSLDVQPGIQYHLTGRDYYGQIKFYFEARSAYDTGDIIVRPNETVLLDVYGIRHP